jgi:hypothetical protein
MMDYVRLDFQLKLSTHNDAIIKSQTADIPDLCFSDPFVIGVCTEQGLHTSTSTETCNRC